MTPEPTYGSVNLPHHLSSFIGRQAELAQLKKLLLTEHRLVTLTGTGGVGKTRLAICTAASVINAFPGGVWFVSLASLTDPHLVPDTVASSLGLKETSGNHLVSTLAAFLQMQNRSILMVLDNCEHLLEECSRLSDYLLSNCPELYILATSREALGVEGEITLRVPSLSVPDQFRLPESPEQLTRYEAVQLFLERATLAEPDFKLSDKTARPISRICVRLVGSPGSV